MTATPMPNAAGDAAVPSRLADLIALGKPRIATLVLVSTALGYALGRTGDFDWPRFLALMAGTALVAWGINALNQYLERDLDALMPRTRNRPLPAGRMTPAPVLAGGIAGTLAGLAVLGLWVNLLALAIAATVAVTYVLMYTPLKRISALNTLVGAVPGALPAPLGWVAASGSLGQEAATLFLIMFAWQLPHFLPIAWLYRDDYRRAHLAMITVDDPTGGSTRRQIVLYTATLMAISLYPSMIGMAGQVYFAGAIVLGVAFFVPVLAMAAHVSDERARWVLKASVLYLPLLLALLAYDATPR